MVRGYFVFAGQNSRDYKIGIEQCPVYPVAQRVVEKTTIPGRSGDVVFDTGAFSNVTQNYEIYFNGKFPGMSRAAGWLAQWLLSGQGYQRLEDSYRPDSYRMALFTGPVDIENWMNLYGRCTLEFDCQPQRWLKSGERATQLQKGTVLHNTGMEALPLLQVTGSGAGVLSVGDVTVNISNIGGTLAIDSATQDAYSGTVNKNGVVTLVNGRFPSLPPGDTGITWSGGITAVTCTPRWWTL